MKKVVLFCLTIFAVSVSISVWANPVKKGDFVVTLPVFSYSIGSGDLYEDEDGNNATVLGLSFGSYEGGIQYLITPNLAIGGIFGFSNLDLGSWSLTGTSFGPMVSFYLPSKKSIPYVGIGYIYNDMKYDADDYDINIDVNITSLVLKAGLASPINQYLAIYGELSYMTDEIELETDDAPPYISIDSSEDGSRLKFTLGLKAFF